MSMASTTVRGAVMLLTFLSSLLNQDHLKAGEMVVVMVCVWCRGGGAEREREKGVGERVSR